MGSASSRDSLLSEMELSTTTLDSTLEFVKKKPTVYQGRLYKELEARFKNAYDTYLNRYGQTAEVEERLTAFSKVNQKWQRVVQPQSFQSPQ